MLVTTYRLAGDLYGRRIVAYMVRNRNDNPLVFDTLDAAQRPTPAHPMFHGDRGFQYTGRVFQRKLKELSQDRYQYKSPLEVRIEKYTEKLVCIEEGTVRKYRQPLKKYSFIYIFYYTFYSTPIFFNSSIACA